VGESEKRDPFLFNFTVYVDVVYLGSSRALFSPNREHIPFALSLSLSLSVFYSYLLFCFMLSSPLGQSAMRKEKKRNNFKLLFEHTSILWPCSVLFSPFIIIITIIIPVMHPVYLSRRRQRRGRSETAYKVKQIFVFFFSSLSFLIYTECIVLNDIRTSALSLYIFRSLSR
jgi:hypothetical protein